MPRVAAFACNVITELLLGRLRAPEKNESRALTTNRRVKIARARKTADVYVSLCGARGVKMDSCFRGEKDAGTCTRLHNGLDTSCE